MLTGSLYLVAAYAASAVKAAAFIRAAGPQCSDVLTPVSITSTIRQFPANFNRATFNYSTTPTLPSTQLSGNYNIAGSFCEPGTTDSARHNTLQILVHGITYTRTYWSGLGHPPQSYTPTSNSWIDYASNQGYPTLAIDRLCNGNSTHPSNDNACQVENQAAVLKALVDGVKSSNLYGGRTFTTVILVGHSFGSLIIEAFTRLFPNEVHGIVLTGFTDVITRGIQGEAASGAFNGPPASQVYPARFGSLDSNYLVISNETLFVDSFYAGSYNTTVAQYDFNTTGTYNFFEVATGQLGQLVAGNYTGDVIVLNGELDGAVCGGNCGEGTTSLTQQVIKLYPENAEFLAYNTGNTGHDVNLHTSAPESFQVIFNELNQQGF